MIENDYTLAWAAYGVAALGCLLVWFRLTGWMWRWLREPLWLIGAVLLLTPTIVEPTKELYAPAVAVLALDLLFKVGNNAWYAVSDLAIFGMVAFACYLLLVALRWPLERWLKGRRQPAPADEDEPTLREMMSRDGADDADVRYDRNGERRMRLEPKL